MAEQKKQEQPAAAPQSQNPELDALKAKESQLDQKLKDLNAWDERFQSNRGHDLRSAKERTEFQLDEVRAAIAKLFK